MLRNEEEVHVFHDRWVASVLLFCRLFLGDDTQAQEPAIDVFLIFLRENNSLELGHIPLALLRTAVKVVRGRCMVNRAPKTNAQSLPSALLALPCEQRAIFILRHVLQLDTATVASVAGIFEEAVHKMSFQALLRIRELLPRKFFKEQIE